MARKTVLMQLFEKQMQIRGVSVKPEISRAGNYTDSKTRDLFNGFYEGYMAARRFLSGYFVVGKIDGWQLQFSEKPMKHIAFQKAKTEMERLMELAPDETFVLYQSIDIRSKNYKEHEQKATNPLANLPPTPGSTNQRAKFADNGFGEMILVPQPIRHQAICFLRSNLDI